MSLRTRVFVLFGVLLLGLIALQALWVRTLTVELSREIGAMATEVGQAVVAVMGTLELEEEEPRLELEEHRSIAVEVVNHTVELVEDHALEWHVELGQSEHLGGLLEGLGLQRLQDAVQIEVQVGAHPRGAQLTGVHQLREIPVRRTGIDEAVVRFSHRMAIGAVVVLLVGLFIAAVAAHQLTAPLRELASVAGRVGAGELGLQVPVQGGGEVGAAVAAFNQMSTRLDELDQESKDLRATEHLSEIGEIGRGLAHTLRNPLNALGLYLDEIASTEDEGERLEIARLARERIGQVDDVIRSFLALASDGAEVELLDVGQLAEDVVLRVLQGARGEVALRVEPSQGCVVRGVPQELTAALQALVVNAVEASDVGDAVVVRVRKICGVVEIEVIDQGPGITPELRERLFTPHVTTKPSGSGMGLFLAQRIASARYGGSVEIEDGDGGGTIARLTVADRRENGHGG